MHPMSTQTIMFTNYHICPHKTKHRVKDTECLIYMVVQHTVLNIMLIIMLITYLWVVKRG